MSVLEEKRCPWCLSSELYRDYHDKEWGVPCTDTTKLFELINLEGAQAGLSWITILNKRDAYRKLFHQFDPQVLARMNDAKLQGIATDPSIVRHKGKVLAVRSNAQALLDMREAGTDFSEFIWGFVDGQVRQNQFTSLQQVPSSTPESMAMSKALKKHGFKFVGATICYAFMQAAGLVNDHLVTCPRHAELSGL